MKNVKVLLFSAILLGQSCAAWSWADFVPESVKRWVADTSFFNGKMVTEEGEHKSLAVNGTATLKKDHIKDTLSVNGVGDLEDVKVDRLVQVNGRLKARNCTFNEVKVNGRAELEKCKILSDATIVGVLEAEDTRFEKLTIYAKKVWLKECSINQSIIFPERSDKKKEEQVLELVDTVVKGDITFEQKDGKVLLVGQSKVLGNIIGAQQAQK
ncbi:MAG: hypothetical protein H6679_03090 [Epsilonproteobacteria bacterium]|nr:hypothetical protein [Campylobacterota bacterium]